MNRIVVGLTGATGQIFGIRALEMLDDSDCESHLVITNAAKMNVENETAHAVDDVVALADEHYPVGNIGAPIASGSYRTAGMLIVPCSMKSLSNIAHANANNLLTRAADVVLKERRPLVVMPREKPIHDIHLQNMLDVSRAGGTIMPPFLSFYRPEDTVDEMVSRTMARALAKLGVDVDFDEWEGLHRG